MSNSGDQQIPSGTAGVRREAKSECMAAILTCNPEQNERLANQGGVHAWLKGALGHAIQAVPVQHRSQSVLDHHKALAFFTPLFLSLWAIA
jgi:hypothetical protein